MRLCELSAKLAHKIAPGDFVDERSRVTAFDLAVQATALGRLPTCFRTAHGLRAAACSRVIG